MRIAARIGLALVAFTPAPTLAQDLGEAEIMVTGTRMRAVDPDADDEAIAPIPAIGLRRRADFALLPVVIAGDTREMERRREEIFTMVRNAIDLARRSGIELATGDFIVTPINVENHRALAVHGDGRPDSEQVRFYIKTRLGAAGEDASGAIRRLEQFVRAVPSSGRAEMRTAGQLTLSVVGPDQYRGQILDLIAADARTVAARFGPQQQVEAHGLERPIEWRRVGATEVFLYIPHRLVFRPAG